MLTVKTFTPTDYFGSNCYLVSSKNEFAVIDPSVSLETIITTCPEAEGNIKYIFLTHAHFDHMIGINTFSECKATVCIGYNDRISLSDPYKNCFLGFLGVHDGYYGNYLELHNGDKLVLGNETLEVIETPGHTPGGVSYYSDGMVFVGDTLFEKGGYGRCDLPGGNIDTLEHSLIKLFARFRDEIIYSGHGAPSTFAETINYFN